MVIIDLITAALIFAQFWVVRWTWLLVLASGFLFTALIFVPFALTFPGVFAPSGLLGAGPQTASWLGVCWQTGIAAVPDRRHACQGSSRETTGICQRAPGLAIVLSIALVTAIVCGLTWAIVAYDAILPQVYVDGTQLRRNNIPIVADDRVGRHRTRCCCGAGAVPCSISGSWSCAAPGCSRFHSAASLRVPATALAGIPDASSSWWPHSSSCCSFFPKTTALYANLARAAIQRRGARQARQIAMDAMAASIGHEINQPLTAVLDKCGAQACAS